MVKIQKIAKLKKRYLSTLRGASYAKNLVTLFRPLLYYKVKSNVVAHIMFLMGPK
jgi:hypothetical protein